MWVYDADYKNICSCKSCLRNDYMTRLENGDTISKLAMHPYRLFIVCKICGNKRCPHANDHNNECTNSNEVGQKGSDWEHFGV